MYTVTKKFSSELYLLFCFSFLFYFFFVTSVDLSCAALDVGFSLVIPLFIIHAAISMEHSRGHFFFSGVLTEGARARAFFFIYVLSLVWLFRTLTQQHTGEEANF